MDKQENHIEKELQDLGAENLLRHAKANKKMPADIKSELLNSIDFKESNVKSSTNKQVKWLWPLGLAASLIIGVFLWLPNTSDQMISMEEVSDEVLEQYLYDFLDELDEEDLLVLASNEVSYLEFVEFDETFLEEEILSNDEYSYHELF